MDRSVAIITARGGSKRIPRKNIKDFLGKPIIAYSIEAALSAGCFDEVMVSTDDGEIAEVAQRYGATVPFTRSAETSDDHSTTADVLVEVLTEYKNRGKEFACACCIYPTAPFVTGAKLKKGHKLLISTGADTALPVVRFGYPVQRALKIEENRLSMIWPEHMNSRSQDLMPAYHDSGQFYWFRVARFLETRKLFAEHTVPIEMPESEVQDIDNEEDWKIAEMKYRILFGVPPHIP
jgi:N-acylneuraminate cytidylyltransferase